MLSNSTCNSYPDFCIMLLTYKSIQLTCLDAFKMKGLRRFCRFHGQHGVKRELLNIVEVRKLAYYGHTMRKEGRCLEKEIMQGTMSGACRQGRPHTAWMDNIKMWTGLPVEESIRMTEDRDKCTKCVHGVAMRRINDG